MAATGREKRNSMKQQPNRLKAAIGGFFYRKRIVYSLYSPPGELIKVFEVQGRKYMRIAFTNRIKFKGTWPITDVPLHHVSGIRRIPSKFDKLLARITGRVARASFRNVKRK